MKVLMLLVLTAATAIAVPPPPWFLEGADNGEVDMDTFLQSYSDARSRGVDAANPIYGPDNPPFGPNGSISSMDDQMKVLILLVDFSDNTAQTGPVYFDSMGFSADTFSLRNYYDEVSLGQIDIITVDWPSTTGWQRAPETYAYYVGDYYGWGSYPTNSQGMVEDVCELVDPIVDFSEYDNDGDGFVDGVNVMFAGTFDGTPQTIWPHAWFLPGGGVTFDGVKVYYFSVQNEYDFTPGDKSAAVFCHEFGHVMGLRDLYDYDYDSKGVGDWCLMAYGVYNGDNWSPAHLSAWCLTNLGLTTQVNVLSDGEYELPAVETSGIVYRLWTGGNPGNQYFLVENRRPIGYDAALPGWGLLIWHIDDSVNGNDSQWYPGYTSYGNYQVALEQADGLWELEQNLGYGDQEDPFPGPSWQNADTFNYWTVPDSRSYTFQDTYVSISSIPPTADTVTVHMSVNQTGIDDDPVPAALPGLTLLSPSPAIGPVEFSVLHGGGQARIAVLDLSGRMVADLWNGPMDAGVQTLSWVPSSHPAGVYFARYTTDGTDSSARLVLLK